MKKLSTLSAILALILPLLGKIIERETQYLPESYEQRASVPILALSRLKQEILSEAAVYVRGVVGESEAQSAQSLKQATSKEITIIIAGITQIKVLEEGWQGSGYHVRAQISLDDRNLLQRVSELADDDERMYELRLLAEQLDRVKSRIGDLKARISAVKQEQEKLKLIDELNLNIVSLTNIDLLYKADMLINLSDYDAAAAILEQVLTTEPENDLAHYQLAICYSKGADPARAIAPFREAIRINPNNSVYYSNLAAAYLNLPQEDNEEAIRLCETAIRLDSLNYSAYNNIAAAMVNQERFEEAIPWCLHALRLDPERSNARHNLASCYLKTVRHAEAQAQIDLLLAERPRDGNIQLLQASAFDLQRKYPEAIAAYKKAIQLDEANPRAYDQLARCLIASVKELDDNDPACRQALDEANQYFQQALTIDPDYSLSLFQGLLKHEPARLVNDMIRMGDANFHKDKPRALKFYFKALELDTACAKAHAKIAQVHFAEGRDPQAQAEIDRALELDPNCLEAISVMYVTLYSREQYEQALPWLKRAAALNDSEAYSRMGVMYDNGYGVTRDSPQALDYFKRAAELGDATSQAYLGYTYYMGEQLPQNYPEAFRLFQLAAEKKDCNGMYLLAEMYYKGKGVASDPGRAYFWWSVACYYGDSDTYSYASKNKDAATQDLSADQLIRLDREVQDWIAAHE
jgi:tetratricopeptide (TPR) repeat protein